MKRLTGYNKHGSVYALGMGVKDTAKVINATLARLAAYEDAGLEPHEVSGLCEMDKRSRMAKMLGWEQAESEGRLVVLPCKVGDRVYVDPDTWFYSVSCYENRFIHSKHFLVGEIVSVIKTKKQLLIKIRVSNSIHSRYRHKRYPSGAIGKTVFLTREEAEEALTRTNE